MRKFLPPANEVCEGSVFTPVCQSFCSQFTGGGIPACIVAGVLACLAGGLQWGGGGVGHVLQVSRPTLL